VDELARYRAVTKEMIRSYADCGRPEGEIEVEVIFDAENDHYELIYNGWHGVHRVEGSVLHIDIRDDKIWIQHDGTEDGVAEEFVRLGIPRDRIVLAFKHPSGRPHTGFAVA
jgi:hypothetical protein